MVGPACVCVAKGWAETQEAATYAMQAARVEVLWKIEILEDPTVVWDAGCDELAAALVEIPGPKTPDAEIQLFVDGWLPDYPTEARVRVQNHFRRRVLHWRSEALPNDADVLASLLATMIDA